MNTNRLVHEKSPYLLQHGHNPVDWYPWGEEAFEKARAEGKPIFLSIGYSTCHWCHVMERESFENEAIAALLNADFVSIKVDREERPDVDRLYMAFVQATTGGGGWPMSVFLTPELKPFFGGTYFPPEDRWGRAGFPTVLRRVAQAWRDDRAGLLARGEEVIAALREGLETPPEALPFDAATLRAGWEQIAAQFDPEWGGFSNAPKFPRPVTLNFLLRFQARAPHSPEGQSAREMALFTLRKMAEGGMNDHLGGGFHRYSVDRFWHIPHFEKMLYDQAQLASAYLDAFQIARDPRDADTARAILGYVRREMISPEGGFFSAEDADSPLPEHPEQTGEGAFYVWSQAEIEAALDPDAAALFCRFYGVEPSGNAPEGSDPHGEFTGKNTLIVRHTAEELAAALHQELEEIEASLEASRRKLLALRAKRPRPHRDDKILTAWNGLMISAFARAAQVLDDPDALATARRAAGFLRANLYREGRLLRSYREGAGRVAGFADDYAFLIQGLLDLYEAGGGIEWLRWASELQQTQDALFADTARGGYFSTAGDDANLLLRLKEDYDGAEPSPNSVAALNALRLGATLDDAALRQRGEATLRSLSLPLARMPSAVPQLLVALDAALSKPKQIVLAGSAEAVAPLLREVHRAFLPHKVILFADGAGSGKGQQWLEERLEFIRSAGPVAGKAAAYVCENFTCQAPVTTPEALRDLLDSAS